MDNINYSKPQVIECLNSLLEENFKNNQMNFNFIEHEFDKPKKIKQNFIMIGTMSIDDNDDEKKNNF